MPEVRAVLGIDAYTARARLAPTVITALPAVALFVGGLLAPGQIARLGSMAIAAVMVLASHLARDAGHNLQDDLWERWGGQPTLRRMRFRGADHPDRVAALHARVEQALGTALPGPAAEDADPAGADAAYADAIARLRNRTRDHKRFPLVFEENVNYGFRRNLLGLKPWGIGIAIVVLVVCVLALIFAHGTVDERVRAWGWPAGVAIAMGAFWLIAVKDDWVRLPAEEYAERLLDAADTLASGRGSEADRG